MGSVTLAEEFKTSNGQDAAAYRIPSITMGSPANKRLRIIAVGAGVSGILIAYKIQKSMQNVDLKIYESNTDIGGTWLLNRYPGCACDIPSHAYQFPFAPNPEWPSFFSSAKDIWQYLDRVVETWDLRRFMHFSTKVVSCVWQQQSSTWRVRLQRHDEMSSNSLEFEEECDVLLHATGVLNNFKWPSIPGIEKFTGKLIHTARWPSDYREAEWKKERVAVIGSGASSIQTVPTMQPHVQKMDVFMRTPVWFVDIAGNEGRNSSYTAEQRLSFRQNPKLLVEHAKFLENQINGAWSMMIKGTPEQLAAQEHYRTRTGNIVKDPAIAKRLTPSFSVGCRRITPGDPYLNAIQQPNVALNFEEVVEITETSVIGKQRTEIEVDTIICATGFDTSFRPAFEVRGKDGVDLREKWAHHPEAYLGLAVPEFPNLFTFIGPSWPIGNGSVMGPLNSVGDYIVQFLQKMQRELVTSFEVSHVKTELLNLHIQEYMKSTVWMDDCRSWYKDPVTNRVNALWPGSSLHYIETLATPRYEDFSFKYTQHNPWAYLGNGHTLASQDLAADKSPYLSVSEIDSAWLRQISQPADALRKTNGTPQQCENSTIDVHNGKVDGIMLTSVIS